MRRLRQLPWLAMQGAIVAICAMPADATDDRAERNRRIFAGWDGMVFSCSLQPNNADTQSMCEYAKQRLRAALAGARIPFMDAGDRPAAVFITAMEAGHPSALPVELRIFATTGNPPNGAYVRLAARDNYISAAETQITIVQAETTARPADVVFWSRDIIGAGARLADLDSSFRRNLETLILQLVADYAEGQMPQAKAKP